MPVNWDYSENILVEQNAIALFADLGWEAVDAFHEGSGERSSRSATVLIGQYHQVRDT